MQVLDIVRETPLWFWAGLVFKTTLLLAVALAATLILRRLPAACKHLLLVLALLGLVAVPALSLLLPSWQLAWLPPTIEEPAKARSPLADGVPASPAAYGSQDATHSPGRLANAEGALQLRKRVLGSSLNFLVESWTSLREVAAWQWLAGLWLAVALLLWGRLALGFVQASSIVRRACRAENPWVLEQLRRTGTALGLRVRPELAYSESVGVPILWGWWRPLLILPEESRDWSQERLQVVFLHELAHFKRRDGMTLLLGKIIACLYWFHPLAWWAESACRCYSERACDDIVLGCGHRPSDYASHLVSIASKSRGVLIPYTPALARRNRMENRLEALLQSRIGHRSISAREVWISLAIFLVALLPLSAAQLVAQPAPSEGAAAGPALTAQLQPVTTPVPAPQPQRERQPYGDKDKAKGKASEAGKEAFQEGWSYHQSDRFDEAIESFEQAAQLGFRRATSYYNIACGYSMLGNRDAALEWLDRALEEGFDSWEHLSEDSDLDPLRSDRRFQELLGRLPAGAELKLRGEDRLTATLDRLDAMQTQQSDDSGEWADLGLDLLRLRQLDSAIGALAKAVDLAPHSSTTAMYNLACAYSLGGDVRAGLSWLERAVDSGLDMTDKIRFDPDLNNLREAPLFEVILDKAETLSLSHFGDWNEESSPRQAWAPAIQQYTDYLRRDPASGRAWFNLGYAHQYAGDYQSARPAFEEALQLGYKPGTTLYNLACGYALTNQIDLAFQRLDQAIAAGFSGWGHLEHDQDLDNLRQDARFQTYRDLSEQHQRHSHREKRSKQRN